MSADPNEVEGPLYGYHHETYVFPLPDEAGTGSRGRWKCRAPREELLWFDRRCFHSEENLLSELQQRIDPIPEVMGEGDIRLQRFIEGSTLGERYPSGEAVPDAVLEQILGLFRQLVAVTPGTLLVKRRCGPKDRADLGDSAGFLERLICFTEERVFEDNLKDYKGLFGDLGLERAAFKALRARVKGLTSRPFCLLHADLHRENFILDPEGKLWAIDWELAMLGDPLYDLATHLYLMR